ncbi:MAG: hypothetical protein K6U03_02545 [Firmicutes bacterium]|nr:hypothetical protein [Bacillota bacterium]
MEPMREPQVILVLLTATLLGYFLWGHRGLTHGLRRFLRPVLILATAFAMLDFERVWVFPLCFGLLVGSLLASEEGI